MPHDQWVAGGLRYPGRAVLGHEIAPPEWFRTSEFLNELAVRAGIYSLVGTVVPLSGDRAAVVGIHRPKHKVAFDREDTRRLDVLIPHLKRSIQLSARLSDAAGDGRPGTAARLSAALRCFRSGHGRRTQIGGR